MQSMIVRNSVPDFGEVEHFEHLVAQDEHQCNANQDEGGGAVPRRDQQHNGPRAEQNTDSIENDDRPACAESVGHDAVVKVLAIWHRHREVF